MNPPRLEGDACLIILEPFPLDQAREAEGPAPSSADGGASSPAPWPTISRDAARQAAYEFRRLQGQEHDGAIGALLPPRPQELHRYMSELDTEDPLFFSHLCVFASRTGRKLGWWVEVEGEVSSADFPWYVAQRLAGQSHRMAKMLATGQTPWIMTDDVFLAGLANQFAGSKGATAAGDYYKRVAESEGVSTTGAVYFPGLASYPGDPQAWIRGRGDIARVAEEKNLTIRGGMLDRQARKDEEPPADVDVADDIVEQRVLQMIDANPELGEQTHTDPGELYHQAKQSLLPAA